MMLERGLYLKHCILGIAGSRGLPAFVILTAREKDVDMWIATREAKGDCPRSWIEVEDFDRS